MSITAGRLTAKSEITVEVIQLSGAPISGKYRIKCADSSGYTATTTALDWNANVHTIMRRINEECPYMRDKVQAYNKAYHFSGGW